MSNKIAALIPVWKRPEILRICVDCLSNEINPAFVLCPSDPHIDEIRDIVQDYSTISITNSVPLGTRMNMAITALMDIDFDYLMNMGSDNVLHEDWVRYCLAFEGDAVGLNSVDAWDIKQGKAVRMSLPEDAPHVYGGGRLISREIIEKLDGNIYPPDISRGMDTSSQERIQGILHDVVFTKFFPKPGRGMVLDIKTLTNINPFPIVERSGKPISVNYIRERYGIGHNSI